MCVGSSTRRTSDFFSLLLFGGIIRLDNITQFIVGAVAGSVAGSVAGGRGVDIEGVVGVVTVVSAAIYIESRTIFVGVVIVIVGNVTDDPISRTRVLALAEGI